MNALPNRKWLKYRLPGQAGHEQPVPRESVLGSWLRSCLASASNFCFGWLFETLGYLARKSFEARLQEHLEFLFVECGGKIVDHEVPKRNPALHGTTVAAENVLLTFYGGHTGLGVMVASKFHPHFRAPFNQFVSDLTSDGDTDERYNLETFDSVLRKRLPLLQSALSEENEFATLTRYIQTRNAAIDAYAARLRASGIEPVMWETPVP